MSHTVSGTIKPVFVRTETIGGGFFTKSKDISIYKLVAVQNDGDQESLICETPEFHFHRDEVEKYGLEWIEAYTSILGDVTAQGWEIVREPSHYGAMANVQDMIQNNDQVVIRRVIDLDPQNHSLTPTTALNVLYKGGYVTDEEYLKIIRRIEG